MNLQKCYERYGGNQRPESAPIQTGDFEPSIRHLSLHQSTSVVTNCDSLRFIQKSRYLLCKGSSPPKGCCYVWSSEVPSWVQVVAGHRVIDSDRLVSEVARELIIGEVSFGRRARDEQKIFG